MTPETNSTMHRSHMHAPQATTPIFSPQFLWKTFRYWWKVVIPTALVLTVAANLIVYWFYVPQYKAFTRLRIKSTPNSILGQGATGGKNSNFVDNQLAIIRSEMVLEPVIAQSEIANIPELAKSRDPVAALAKDVKVSQIDRSEYYEVSYSHPNPKAAAAIVDAVVTSYLALFGDIEDRRATSVERLLQDEKTKREAEVQTLETKLRDLARKAGGQLGTPVIPNLEIQPGQVLTNVDGSGVQFGPQLTSIQSQLATRDLDLIVVRRQIAELEQRYQQEPITVSPPSVEALLAQSPGVLNLNNQIAAARSEMVEAQKNAAEKDPTKDPTLRKYAARIANLEKVLADTKSALRPTIETSLRTEQEQLRQQNLETLKSRERDLQVLVDALNAKYEKELDNVRELASETMMEIEFTRMELSYSQQMLGTINSRLMAIGVEKSEPSQVEHVFEKARIPSEPNELLPYRQMSMASAITMLLPLGLALLWEIRVRRISSMQELEANTCQLPVVAEVTRLPIRTSGSSTSYRLQQELWLFEESVETLRTCLMLSEPGSQVRVIAVTSAAAREGKTSVASQLAVSLASSTEQRTLLIDGDMRSPDIHSIFDVVCEHGLTDVLAQKSKLEDAVCPTWQENLDVMAAGRLACSPHSLLGNGAFRALITSAREKYAFIVIDTPPILAASEALIMAKEADASLLCAMRSVSRTYQVRSAHERLRQSGANPLGLVLNGVPTQSYYYKYGKYSYARD